MVVVADAELLPDQVADSRPRPHATHVPRRLRTGLDQLHQFGALLLGQLRCRPRRLSGLERLCPSRVVPADPVVDRGTDDIEFLDECQHGLALDVAPYRSGAPPRLQVADLLRSRDQRTELRALVRREPFRSNRLAGFRSRLPLDLLRPDGVHDCFRVAGDRRTMIFSRSRVNPVHQATRSCLDAPLPVRIGTASHCGGVPFSQSLPVRR
jgi:hypothetical protein